MEDLKPCPFCGGEAVIRVLMGREFIRPIHRNGCLMRVDTWLIADRPINKQIKAWNRRAKNEPAR